MSCTVPFRCQVRCAPRIPGLRRSPALMARSPAPSGSPATGRKSKMPPPPLSIRTIVRSSSRRRAAIRPPMSCASATSPISSTTGPRPSAAAPKALETVPSIPLTPRLHSTRGGSARTGQKLSMSRTGIEEATNRVASRGSSTPSSVATEGSPQPLAPSTPRIASAASSSALRQLPSQSGSPPASPATLLAEPVAEGTSSAPPARSASESASTSDTTPAGSWSAPSGSSAIWRASVRLASHVRKGLDVGRSPTRSTRSGLTPAANGPWRSSAS